MRPPTHAIGLGVASAFAMAELPHAVIASAAMLVAGVLAATGPMWTSASGSAIGPHGLAGGGPR